MRLPDRAGPAGPCAWARRPGEHSPPAAPATPQYRQQRQVDREAPVDAQRRRNRRPARPPRGREPRPARLRRAPDRPRPDPERARPPGAELRRTIAGMRVLAAKRELRDLAVRLADEPTDRAALARVAEITHYVRDAERSGTVPPLDR